MKIFLGVVMLIAGLASIFGNAIGDGPGGAISFTDDAIALIWGIVCLAAAFILFRRAGAAKKEQ